jgi:hypothetical protein
MHCCGGIWPLLDGIAEAEFGILNPVQCSAYRSRSRWFGRPRFGFLQPRTNILVECCLPSADLKRWNRAVPSGDAPAATAAYCGASGSVVAINSTPFNLTSPRAASCNRH